MVVVDRAIDDVELRLPKAAAISGQIVDSRGDPVLGLPVTAEIRAANDPQATLVTAATTRTDDLGAYRLGGLPAGDVFIAINVGAGIVGPGGDAIMLPGYIMTTVVDGRAVTVRSDSVLTRTYYPGVTSLAEARSISLSAGEEKTSIDFLVPSSRARTVAELAGGVPAARIQAAGAIRGRITRIDGRPLPNAVVRIAGGFPPPTAVTDDEGRYELLNVPAGSYHVLASRPGFIAAQYGQRRPVEPGETVEVAPGDAKQRIDITLPDPGTIAGRIVDDGGEAVEGADVRVLQIRYEAGRRRLVDVSGVAPRRTDNLGRYRVYGLAPGEYIVRALVGQLATFAESTLNLPGLCADLLSRNVESRPGQPRRHRHGSAVLRHRLRPGPGADGAHHRTCGRCGGQSDSGRPRPQSKPALGIGSRDVRGGADQWRRHVRIHQRAAGRICPPGLEVANEFVDRGRIRVAVRLGRRFRHHRADDSHVHRLDHQGATHPGWRLGGQTEEGRSISHRFRLTPICPRSWEILRLAQPSTLTGPSRWPASAVRAA